MSRKKADGARAKGIQSKKGMLYITKNKTYFMDGVRKNRTQWYKTGLKDSPENVKKALEYRETLLHAKATIDRNISINDYINLFLAKKKREISDTTYSNYLNWTKSFKSYFEGYQFRKLSTDDVQSYLDFLFDKRDLQPRSVKDIKSILSKICKEAIKDGVLTYNPVAEATINKKKAADHTPCKGDDDFFDYDQALEFLKIIAYKYSDPQDPDIKHPLYYAFYLALVLSLRREEVLGLRWENVDLKNRTIRISSTVTKGTKINRNNTTKTRASQRTYVITDELVDALYHLKKYEVKNRTLFGSNYIDNDYLVKKQDGSLYYPDTLSKIFRRIIQSHPELPQNITLHGLRSSCVSILVHDGYDLKSIQDYVGHEDETTTLKIYAKVKSKESKKEITQDLSTKLPFYINNNN